MISRTLSCGRQRRTPLSVSTSGRSIRIGCVDHRVEDRVVADSGAVRPSSAASGSLARRPSRGVMPRAA